MPAYSHRPARAGSVRIASWQRQRLGDADRRRIMEKARHLERHSHQPGWHGGALKRTGIAVLWAMLYRGFSRHGVCDPSIDQIAEAADCVSSTAKEAIARLEALGIMGHVRRGVVVASRWCQWTNAYFFASPERWASEAGSRPALVSTVKKKAQERAPGGAGSTLLPDEVAALVEKWGLGAVALPR